ncbi:MAG: DNA (cytosine-5-)-methyltransferase [Cyanobacteriota bacterium]|nr:DNA (cytosine-5-)-methyltransferase [Cyanobacteriota bacterium]
MTKKIFNAVELFCGIGGFRIAADAEGLATIWANDNCQKAGKVYGDRFGIDHFHLGDIRAIWQEIPPHDLLTAGFPCQPFSSAGKKQGLRDARGHLFEIIIEVLQKNTPQFFILENVKRILSMESGCHFATILSQLTRIGYKVEWRLLNAIYFGLPQNRERVLLVGELVKGRQINDYLSKIRLASEEDIYEIDKEGFLETENWLKLEKQNRKFPGWGMAFEEKFFAADLTKFSEGIKLVPFKTIIESNVNGSFDLTESTIARLANSSPVNRFVNGVEILYNQKGGARMGYTVFGIGGIAPTLTSTTSRHYERYKIGDKYRRLTDVEYARLQGFPDDHCSAVARRYRYILYGNAVPPPMVRWTLQKITGEPKQLSPPKYHQLRIPFS